MLSGKLPRIDSPALFETWLAAEYSTKGEGGAGSRVEQTGRARNDANAAAEAKRNKSKKKPWQRARVFKDILEGSSTAFPADNRDQWRALNTFHTAYLTSDSLPMLPIPCAPPAATAETSATWTMQL
eukprot:5906915-Pleurochrysis_carterae.AAC.1